nr:shikimate kinase [Schlegelella koreensis]
MISLVGLPGVGKSTIGRRLAARLDLAFADSDALIEARIHEPIRNFFEREGEARFRDLEESVIAELCAGSDAVIATGGGAVVRPANRAVLRERTVAVYLHAPPDPLFERLRRDTKRPLLQVADPLGRLRELSRTRDPLYREVAELTLDVAQRPVRTAVDAIIAHLGPRPPRAS